MLFMPNISIVHMRMAINLSVAFPSSDTGTLGNDKAVAQPTFELRLLALGSVGTRNDMLISYR